MSKKLLSCGGLYIDDETIKEEDGVLSASGGGGSDLPTVTADDNGDVLTVVDGAWAKAAPSGGALLAGITKEEDSSEKKFTINKTAREIISAFPLIYIGEQIDTPEIKGAHYMPVYLLDQNDAPYTIWLYYESDVPGFSAGYNFMLDASILSMVDSDITVGTYTFNAPTLDDYPICIIHGTE